MATKFLAYKSWTANITDNSLLIPGTGNEYIAATNKETMAFLKVTMYVTGTGASDYHRCTINLYDGSNYFKIGDFQILPGTADIFADNFEIRGIIIPENYKIKITVTSSVTTGAISGSISVFGYEE